LCGEFVKVNGLNEPREDWHHNLIHPSGECSHGNDLVSSANVPAMASADEKTQPKETTL